MIDRMRRSDTKQELSVIEGRNKGHRESLILRDDYEGSPDLSSGSNASQPKTRTDVPVAGQKARDQVTRRISEIAETRVRRWRPAKVVNEQEGFVSKFQDVNFNEQTSTMFDAEEFKDSKFFGFYILFWLATGFSIFNNLVHYWFEGSVSFLEWPLIKILTKDLFKVGLTDLAMYLCLYLSYFLQRACLSGWINWNFSGWIIEGALEVSFLVFWVWFASERVMDFPWVAKIFLMLHGCVLLMKMHSYSFYNGYLWQIHSELEFSENLYKRLNEDEDCLPEGFDLQNTKKTLEQSMNFCRFELDYQSTAASLPAKYESAAEEEKFAYLVEATSFPHNINVRNFFEYTMFPTLVYTINFPRTSSIRWKYVFEKTCAIFGVIFLMISVAQKWLYPSIMKCLDIRTLPTDQKAIEYGFLFLDMVIPFLLEYLLTFYLIWDAILSDIAELTRFADRDFYGPWWSCTDWSEFSRIWNRPVHKFLLRHVYHSSISAMRLNKYQASLMTFFISSLLHELAMYVIFGTLRGYLLLLQMSQIPMIIFSRSKSMRNRKILGNVVCWFGFVSGPSLVCTLYLIF